jgi:peptidoglycan/LPS O-acetylase OafA/YrhL
MAEDPAVAYRPNRGPGYLPTLDGWRALAILSVLLSHDAIHGAGPFSTAWFYRHGALGVDVFFAISGLLICSRLLQEESRAGAISLRRFYIRRAFRILPAALFFLLTLLLLKRFAHLPVGVPEVFAALFFVRNYTFTFTHWQAIYPIYTAHFWSLAVEEHFYLFLPALLVWAPRRWRVPILLGIAVVVGLHRLSLAGLSMHTGMRIDALLIPAALAILMRRASLRERLLPWLRLWPGVALALLACVTWGFAPRASPLAIAWLTPPLLLGTVLRPASWFSRLLECPPMRYLGRLSYSLYLWQQLFVVAHFGAGSVRFGALQRAPLCFGMAIGCSLVSYYCVEQPLLRLGHRLASPIADRPMLSAAA